MAGPLAGMRVIELAGIGPGPFCGMLLGDLGADVVVIERPLPAGPEAALVDNGMLRRNRRSLVADLKSPGSADMVLDLVREADIIFEGMRPGVAERLGVGPEACLAVNPRVVYGRMTGWGQHGPLARRAGHDLNYISMTGVLNLIGHDRPAPPLNLVGDFGGGAMLLAVGLLAAVTHARTTGEGQVVDAAMFDGTNLLMTMFWDAYSKGSWIDRRASNILNDGSPFNTVYQCRDGSWLAVAPIEPQFRERMMSLMELTIEPGELGLDREMWPALEAKLRTAFASRDRDEWLRLLSGSDTCVTPVLGLDEVPLTAHARARGSFLPAPRGGQQPAPAPRFSVTTPADPALPPAYGADTDTVLAEIGYSPERIACLREVGAIS
ncbi:MULTISPECIES: CaiB/BaiF CoA-transferase family protein [unclassified Nocardioides]|uniref:CaiB/BaiF CoA transferase family protein n=1 Tax=unclassified Nocardioides TaxID=2615069 RepID=UPI000057128F|nr:MULTISPECIES: CaiB/BaiF CoA-transferase family protein [unclassified Nocardioides]ABL80337.1 L-carnitine dehydratase/bile acid-inducible protein F [Nocardioides sp. JS614]